MELKSIREVVNFYLFSYFLNNKLVFKEGRYSMTPFFNEGHKHVDNKSSMTTRIFLRY